jgi:hypothetical protein
MGGLAVGVSNVIGELNVRSEVWTTANTRSRVVVGPRFDRALCRFSSFYIRFKGLIYTHTV